MKACAESFPENIRMMMGLHPSSVREDFMARLSVIKRELDSGNYIGVGEIGMDLYWDTTYKKEQTEAFRVQCQWAAEKKLPVSIHSRSAYNEVVSVLSSLPDIPSGIFHCFGAAFQRQKKLLIWVFTWELVVSLALKTQI